MSSSCAAEHDTFATALTFTLTIGLCLSFIPQHVKIIRAGQSFGFSPWFLLLGSTSSTAALMDIYLMQWDVIRCCKSLSTGLCLASLGGIFQITLQWTLFNITFLLFIIYYPSHMKFVHAHDDDSSAQSPVRSRDWTHSLLCAQLTVGHFIISLICNVFFLSTETRASSQVAAWSTFLGVSSAGLSLLQYWPQIWRTWGLKLVGAISVPLLCFEVPGAAIMVISIAMREGTDWTNWAMYAASGSMAGILLALCLAWKVRQRRLGIDDFGRSLKLVEARVDEASPLLSSQQT